MAVIYDPNNPVYPEATSVAIPELENPTATVTATTGSDYIDPSKTSANIAAGLISDGNPFAEAAKASTSQTYADRGLLNSSMNATAGTKAAMDAVQPYALQDSELYGTAALAQQNTDNTADLNTQTAQLDTTKLKNTGLVTGALSEQNFSNQLKTTNFEYPMQKELAQMGYDSSERIAMASAISSQTNTMMSIVGSLLNNTDVEMSNKVTDWASNYMNSSWSSLGELFNIDVSVV